MYVQSGLGVAYGSWISGKILLVADLAWRFFVLIFFYGSISAGEE